MSEETHKYNSRGYRDEIHTVIFYSDLLIEKLDSGKYITRKDKDVLIDALQIIQKMEK